jgi:3-dehydroquinate synthase
MPGGSAGVDRGTCYPPGMPQPEPRRISVGVTPSYDILIGHGVSRELPRWLARERPGSRFALVTDSNVAPLHAGTLRQGLAAAGIPIETIVVEAGERHKTRATKERIEDGLAAAGLGRDAVILALGGGMLGDLAGFTAATWCRGIGYVQIPTTLLAMVDASVGGKTGVDHPAGKNLIGAFHQPLAVFADVDFLETLDDRQLRSGLAEVVKCGVVGDAELFERVEALAADHTTEPPGAALTRAVRDDAAALSAAAVALKAAVVAADPQEEDLRRVLNFGHTVGHALESLSGYTLTHGEAVSLGMVAEARMAGLLGLLDPAAADRIETLLDRIGLPVRLPAEASTLEGARRWSETEILDAARLDKKARAGRLVFALPCAVGRMARTTDGGHGIPVDQTVATDALAALTTAPRPR